MKTIADLIAAAVPALVNLRASLVQARDALIAAKGAAPDLAPLFDARIAELDAKIVILDSVSSASALAALAITVVNELAALPKVGLQPKFHPGDVTGG